MRQVWAATLGIFAISAASAFADERRDADSVDAAYRRSVQPLIEAYCLDCHAGDSAESGFDLESLAFDLDRRDSFDAWVRAYDKLQTGEMPPADAFSPDEADREAAVTTLRNALQEADATRQSIDGRVQLRRLTREEYENSLRDLLALPNLEVKDLLPSDDASHGFDNVGSALNLSYVQMARYLDAADLALDAAATLGPKPESERRSFLATEEGRFAGSLRNAKEAVLIGDAVGLLRQPNTAQAPWTWGKFRVDEAGTYRLRMKAYGFFWDRGNAAPPDRPHVVTFQAINGTHKRSLGSRDVPASPDGEPIELVTWLHQGDQVEIWFETLDDRNKPASVSLNEYRAPGIAVDRLDAEGPLVETWPPESYRRLFDDLPMKPWTEATGFIEPAVPIVTVGHGKRAQRTPADRKKLAPYFVASEAPIEDARRLLSRFAERAYRRPLEPGEIEAYLDLVEENFDAGHCFQEALRVGHQAVLCSPDFLFFREEPGPLDDYALATRLSYFLWKSTPDEELFALAAAGRLRRPETLRDQVERMLDDPKRERFVESFTGQWLDLRRIGVTQPDEELYPEFDRWLLDSMVAETTAYFDDMIVRDLGIGATIDSDFTMANARLAEHYGLAGVDGVAIRRVDLPADSPRGGFLTQASVLKVTANGTTTSPVTRGAWILDRLLGEAAAPPPPNVPAVEPDLRGAVTIREQLAEHRESGACASCHAAIDPPGFALESFDVIGGWRDRYRSLEIGEAADRTVRDGRPVRYKLGLPVDASGVAPNGEAFGDVEGFREIVLRDEAALARNLARRLMTFATGAEPGFADRLAIERILDRARDRDYGVRTLIHEIVRSEPFLNK